MDDDGNQWNAIKTKVSDINNHKVSDNNGSDNYKFA